MIKNEFSKNTLSLISGSIVSQAIPAALAPILTRIYTPEDYGLFAIYASLTALFTTIATAKYDAAILIPKSDKEAINIMMISVIMTFIISLFSFIIILIFNQDIVDFVKKPEISNWLYLIPFSVLISGIYQILVMWSTRKKRFKRLSLNMVIHSSVNSSTNLALGLGGFGVVGLVYASLLGQVVILWHLLKKTIMNDKKLFKYAQKTTIKRLMRRYKKMPLIALPNVIIDNFRMTGLNLLVVYFFTTTILGSLSLSFRVIRVPMSIIGDAITRVFMQKLAVTKKEEYYKLLMKYTILTTLFGLPIYIFFYIYSAELFVFVFGENWKLAGEIGSISSIWSIFSISTITIANFLTLIHRQEIVLIFSILYSLVLGVIFFFFNTGEFLTTFSNMVFSMIFLNILFVLYGLLVARNLSKT